MEVFPMTQASTNSQPKTNDAKHQASSGPATTDFARFERFKYMAELSADWYWAQDEQFRFLRAYKVRGHTGFAPESYLGKRRWEVPGVLEDEAFWAAHRAVLEAHQPFRDFEFSVHTEQGRTIWVSISGDPVFDTEGRFCGYRGIGRTITRQKRVEAALHELANFNVGVLNAISAQICVLDAEGTILATNAAWRKVAESNAQDLAQRVEGANYFHICAAVTGNDSDTARAASAGIALVAAGQNAEFQLDYSCSEKDKTLWYQLRATRIEGNGLPKVVVAHYDITAIVHSQDALRVALNEKETLLREMHHRVKNNLQVISGLLHFQSKRARHEEDKAVFEQGQARLRAMILLHESLYETPALSSVEFEGYLRALVEELVSAHGQLSERVTCKVQTEKLNLPIQIAMPCGMLLNELLSNAFKHAFPGERRGCIEVHARHDGSTLVMTVKDDGVGAETFVSLSRGFGLRLVEKLVDQMNAKMIHRYHCGVSVEIHVPLRVPMKISAHS